MTDLPEMLPLQCLVAGQCGRISQLLGSPEQVHRLEEIGMRLGALVEMLQAGSPCIVRLDGQKLCFRADELLRVLVEPGVAA